MEFLTVEEVAKTLKVQPAAVREWLKQGTLVGVKLGRIWRIEEKDLEDFVNKAKKRIEEG